MPNILRPILARLVGIVVAAVVTWLAAKYGIVVPEEDKAKISDGIVIALMTIFTVVYALTHKAVSIKTNPADAATPTLAAKGKDEQRRLG